MKDAVILYLNTICRSPRESVNWNLRGWMMWGRTAGRSPRESVNWNLVLLVMPLVLVCRSPRESVNWNCIWISLYLHTSCRSPRESVNCFEHSFYECSCDSCSLGENKKIQQAGTAEKSQSKQVTSRAKKILPYWKIKRKKTTRNHGSVIYFEIFPPN